MSQSFEPGKNIRSEFPSFEVKAKRPLSFLDSAASSLKPRCVIERISNYLSFEHSNIHRGAYELSAKATENYENARAVVAAFIGAARQDEVIFTKGATEGINLVASSLWNYFKPGDVILLTLLEHHSNIVPWQILAERRGLKIAFVDLHDDGTLNMQDLKDKLRSLKPKIVATTWVSNAIGTVVPVAEVANLVKASGAKYLIDACQSVQHEAINVGQVGCDFLAFSGHKIYGPTGIGCVYINSNSFDVLEPYQGGGDMISQVTVDGSTWAEPPRKFEAGTPPIAEAIGLGRALEFVNSINIDKIKKYESSLFQAAFELMRREPGVSVYGPALIGKDQAGIISFNIAGVHPHDVATVADSFNVQLRAGHHCAMPLLKRMGLQSTARASLGVYSDISDFEVLLEAIRKARKMFG